MLLQLYLHFPFCKRKCFYCDFCSSVAGAQTIAAYCFALEKEIELMGKKYPDAQVTTVFLGGGTPTLVPAAQMEGVLKAVHRSFRLAPGAEFTSEGNPGTLTEEWLNMAQRYGLNRLSLGVQAAQDDLFKAIGRIHTFSQAADAVDKARRCGIQNLNLDAMFGLPGQSEQDYLDTLAAFRDLGAEHISAYSLILEEGTQLEGMVKRRKVSLPSEDETALMYEQGIEWLEKNGYERYEVSNFARPGYACRHNLGYWQGEWYLGLGVAAHSMLPPEESQRARGILRIRRANGTDVSAYIRAFSRPGGHAPLDDMECIRADEAMFETIMLSLRTTAGVDDEVFRRQFGVTLADKYGPILETVMRDGLGFWRTGANGQNCFALTSRGIEVQNDVLLRFME